MKRQEQKAVIQEFFNRLFAEKNQRDMKEAIIIEEKLVETKDNKKEK